MEKGICWLCSGKGWVYQEDPETQKETVVTCPVCEGSGKTEKEESPEEESELL